MIFSFLFLIITLSQSDSTGSSHSNFNTGMYIHSSASADLREGLSSISTDTLIAFPVINYKNEYVKFKAVACINYTVDSSSVAVNPVSARTFFRWPGSPWIASGVTRGPIDFYIPGLSKPVYEWNSINLSDSTTVTLQAGGLMGFDGFWHQMGDSLSWSGINSPWLGFGMVDFDFVNNKSSSTQTISGFLALKKIQPWFVFVEDNSDWSYFAEVRDWKPFSNRFVAVEIVPELSYTPDSTEVGLTGYIWGQNLAIAGSIAAFMDIENQSDPSFAATFDLFSETGISWSLEAHTKELDDYHGSVSGFYRMSPAGCGGKLDVSEDSIRVTATAFYSPVSYVSTELSVMADISEDSPSPGCSLNIFGATGYFTSNLALYWQRNITTLGIGVSAWLN